MRSAICSLCGLTTHDARQCPTPPEIALARMEDASIRCMSCNQLGHALCKRIAKNTVVTDTQHIFCPNCGMEGHHVDYPADYLFRKSTQKSTASNQRQQSHAQTDAYLTSGLNPCQAPKLDAYLKFNELMRYPGTYINIPSQYIIWHSSQYNRLPHLSIHPLKISWYIHIPSQ